MDNYTHMLLISGFTLFAGIAVGMTIRELYNAIKEWYK